MPQLGETVTEGTILRWLVKVGDEVKEDDPILEISTDKVDTEVPSPFNGTVSNLLVEEGETVEVGASLLELDGDKANTNDTPPKKEPKDEPKEETNKENVQDQSPKVDEAQNHNISKTPNEKQNLQLSPVVRKLAAEHNIDIEKVQGTGKDGRIKRQDIEKIISSGKGVISTEKIDDQPPQEKEKEMLTKESSNNISRLRKRIAENMVMSKQTSAHVMTSIEVDFENIEIVRAKHKAKFKEENGFSLTYLPFISLATVSALREYSVVNSSFDLENGIHEIHNHINLGIAVDLNQEGLLVGTLQEADSFNLKGIARKISENSKLLRDGKYGLDDVSGSTFTISNNGSFNSFLTSPIINQPNVAILSTESVKKKPVVVQAQDGSDSIAIRHTGILSITWDHRVFDGSVALLFLNFIKERLENADWSQELD
jgi:2-oxoglutarate dehydrogenase E2 component (dihydrolipoamide succinyltransferase)